MGGPPAGQQRAAIFLMRAYSSLPVFLGVLLLALLGAYHHSFHNGFHYDDFHSIVDNPHLRDAGNIGRFFLEPEMFSALPERAMYRPLLLFSLALNYRAGGYSLPGFHLVNWGIHLGCAFLLYLLGRSLLGAGLGAGLGALFFALQPLQAETVNYISSRSESLAGLFYLGGLLAYGHWRQRRQPWLYAFSLAALVCGLLSKSTAISLPLALMLWEWVRRPGQGRVWTYHLGYWLAAGAYLLITRGMVEAVLGQPVRPLEVQVFTQLKAAAYYLYLFAAPIHLSVEHPFTEATSLLRFQVVLPLFLLVSLGAVGGARWRKDWPPALLLAAWAGLALLPSAGVPLNVLVNEHRLYLPAAFASLGLAGAWAGRRQLLGPAGVLLVVMGVLAHQRTRVWQDELSLWQDAVERAPLMYRPHLHLGGALEQQGRIQEALAQYQRAVQLAPEVVEAHYNLGNGLRLAGRRAEAAAAYEQSLALNSQFFQSLVNLASLCVEEGQFDRAEELLLRARQQRPEEAEIHRQLGVVYKAQGRLREAEAAYLQALGLRPDLAEAYYNLGNLHFDMGRYPEAIRAYEQTLSLAAHGGAYYNLGDLYLQQGDCRRAAQVFSQGLERLPGEAKLYYGLARAQEGLGQGQAAAASYRSFLQRAQVAPGIADQVRRRLQALEWPSAEDEKK